MGLLVNAAVWPPLRRRTAIAAIDRIDDRIGGLLVGPTDDDIDSWGDRSQALDDELDHVWALVRQAQESARMNPRRSARHLRDPHSWSVCRR